MRSAGTAKPIRFLATALLLWTGLAATATIGAAGGARLFAVADDTDRAGDQLDGGESDSPGSMQPRHDFDTPSEDGTEDAPRGDPGDTPGDSRQDKPGEAPGAAAPDGEADRPPGCIFRDGPLELFV